MAAIAPLLAALSLNTHLPPAQRVQPAQPTPCHRDAPAPARTCTRTKLRLFKQAAKGKFRRAVDKKMTSRPARTEVIEISDDDDDDDEDELPYPQRPPIRTLPSHQSQNSLSEDDDEDELPYRQHPPTRILNSSQSRHSLIEGDDEAESDNFSTDSESSDSASPPHPNRCVVLHHRPRRSEEAGKRSSSSGTTSDDSEHMADPPKMQHTPRIPPIRASSSSVDEDAGYVTAPPNIPRLKEASSSTQVISRSTPSHQTAVREADQCPYYHDHKLDVKMYRGQGYEKFPVVLGTVEGHKEICDKWDAQLASKNIFQDTYSTDTGVPHAPTRSFAELEVEDACLQAVLQIFPEIEHEFVRNLYRNGYSGAIAEDLVGIVSGALIADIAESETYPRQKNLKRKASPGARDETGVTVGWNKNLLKNHIYRREAIILLATAFDHIPTHYISKIVQEKQALFDAFGVLSEKENNFYNQKSGERPYKRLRQPRRDLEIKYQRKSFEQRDSHQYVNLVNELQAARQNQAREASRIKRQKAADDFESENLASHVAQGSMVECQCCFDEKPINRAVPCEGEEAHFFCNDCVKRQAESQIGAMKYEMLCMDTSGCKAELSTEGVAQAIPLQLYDKLAFNQQQAEISLADIQGLEMCPFCDFKAICEPVEVDSVFDCQNPDCALVTCRKCKERSHLPRTCEEVKNDKGLGARHKVEEARSEAMMRTCPKCKVKLIKEYGCNKMVCTNCRAIMCYVCQKDISGSGKEHGYDHFHRAGATCALHDQTGTDRHKAEADAAETAAIAKAKAEYEDIDEKALQIETGENNKDSKGIKALAMPPAPQLRGVPYPAFLAGAHMPPLPAMPQFPALPQFPAMPQFDPNPFLGQTHQVLQPNFQQVLPQGQAHLQGQMHQVLQPNFQQVLPQGQAHLQGQMQLQLNQMQVLNMQLLPPNVQAGPALPLDPGLQQRQALQAFVQQRRRMQREIADL